MQHLENIQKLFAKNFVESPLLETFEVGEIEITSCKLVACDPIITNDKEPFTIHFPKGNFPAFLYKERESNCVAYAEIVFSEAQPVHWEMAVTSNQSIKDLKGDEIFGYPVESGMGCFMDAETQDLLNEIEQQLFQEKGENFMGIYEDFFHEYFFDSNGAIDQFAFLKPFNNKKGNILAFETGYGEGFYATYIGFDNDKNPVKVIAEFIEILVNES